mgnify:CR=1 FL=1
MAGRWGCGRLLWGESLCFWTFWARLDLPYRVTLERSFRLFSASLSSFIDWGWHYLPFRVVNDVTGEKWLS